MFGRKKDPVDAATPVIERAERPGAKNRPTPSRREQEAARKRPLVPTDRKSAARAERDASRLARMRTREAMVTGDEAHLPLRDKGPVKRLIRDCVDSRWSVGEFMLPVMAVVLILSLVANRNPSVMLLVFLLVYGLVIAGIVDAFLMWRRIKARIVARFGEDPPKGSAFYAVMRAFQLRRSRMPRALVKRGEKPA